MKIICFAIFALSINSSRVLAGEKSTPAVDTICALSVEQDQKKTTDYKVILTCNEKPAVTQTCTVDATNKNVTAGFDATKIVPQEQPVEQSPRKSLKKETESQKLSEEDDIPN